MPFLLRLGRVRRPFFDAILVASIFTGLLLLAGCKGNEPRLTKAQPEFVKTAKLPFPEAEPGPKELTGDMLYAFLVGEIGAQRGELELAYGHYLHAAILTQDAYAAERATRIAVFLKKDLEALKAARRWVQLAPNAIEARQEAALAFARHKQPVQALNQLKALLSIAKAEGEDGYLQIARLLLKNGIEPLELDLMARLVEENDGNASAHYALALLQTGVKKRALALANLERSIEIKPDWAEPRVLKARVLLAQKRKEQALEGLAVAIRKYPDSALLRTAYARFLSDADRFDESLEQFQRLTKDDPKNADLLYAQGLIAVQAENWPIARRTWQDLRLLGERFNEATYFLGQVEEVTENLTEAEGLYASIKEGALRTDAGIRRASLLAKRGQIKQARQLLRDLRVLDKDRAIALYLAEIRLLQNLDETAEVYSVFQQALRYHPSDINLLYNRAIFAAEVDDLERMERDFKQVLKLKPGHPEALNALGYTLANKTDRVDEAYGYIMQALKALPDSPAVLDSMGWVLYKKGELAKSLEFLQKAYKTAKDGEIAAHLGEVLWQSGQNNAAKAVWEKALKEDPEHPVLRKTLNRFNPAE